MWKPYTTDTKSYLDIDINMNADNAKEGLHEKRMQLWNDVIFKIADQPWVEATEECPTPTTDGDDSPQVELGQGTLQGNSVSKDGI